MNFIACLIASSSIALTHPTSFTDYPQYENFCYQAATDEALFQKFKGHETYRSVLEHVSYEIGKECLQIIQEQTPEFFNLMNIFRQTDSIGAPYTYYYPKAGQFSPTTLRYIKVASDLKVLFGSELDQANIVEIGGGFGGQCKIISDLYTFKSYTIIDLPGPLALTRKFLESQGVKNVIYKPFNETISTESFDLAISNYAYTECTPEMQDKYCQEVLSRSTRGYMICTDIPRSLAPQQKEALLRLSQYGIKFEKFPESPCTNPDNYLVVWKANITN